MWGSSIEGEEKERGFISGNSFPLILRKAFSPSVVFFFLYFFVFLGDYKGAQPTEEDAFPSSVVFVFLSFLSFSFIFPGDYKGAQPTEEDVFPSSVVFILYVFCFSKGVIGGSVSPYSSDS